MNRNNESLIRNNNLKRSCRMNFLIGGVLAISVAECTNEPKDRRMLEGMRTPSV